MLFSFRSIAFSSRGAVCFLVSYCCLTLAVFCFQEKIDYIVAVVNEKVITFTDLRVAEAFGLYEDEIQEQAENPFPLILDKLIDQKLVIQLASENISVQKGELDSSLRNIEEKIGLAKLQTKLEEFGMELDDLREHIREKIMYQKIISQKFSQVRIVSLREIETYYRDTYVSSQKKKGAEVKPMMDVLGEIELRISQDRIREQVEDWLKNLRKQAEIQINPIRI